MHDVGHNQPSSLIVATTTRAVYGRARAVRDDVEMATDDAMNVLARAGGAREDDGGATRRAGRDARGVGDA